MKTKIRISIWIMAMFLVFFGIGLSSRQALAASGISTQRAANISVYYSQRSLVSIFSVLPSIGVAPTELSASHWQEMERITAPLYAASSYTSIDPTVLSLSYRQLMARSMEQASAARASSGAAVTELPASHWQEMERITAPFYRQVIKWWR